MRRAFAIAAVACLATGCDSVINVCNVDQQVEAAVSSGEIVDCGSFYRGGVNYTDDAMLAAQRCVLNAIASKSSFRLVYDADPTSGTIEPGLRAGWVGISSLVPIAELDLSADATFDAGVAQQVPVLTIRAYAGRGGGDMASKDDLVSVLACDSVDATQSCKPRVGTPCLTCTTVALASVQCRG